MSCECDNWLERQQQGLPGRCDRHARMMATIHKVFYNGTSKQAYDIYAAGDGFMPGQTGPDFEWDWSGIRDSSTEAVERMYEIATEANTTGRNT